MSQAIVEAVRAKYPTPLGVQHAAFLLETAAALELGLLRKDTGTNILLPDGVRVAQDIVMAPDGRIWDILRDGEGAAEPTFNPGDPVDPSRFYAVNGAPTPPEPPPVTPPVDLSPILARLDAVEAADRETRVLIAESEQRIHHIINTLPTPVIPPIPTKAKGKVSLGEVLQGREVTWRLEP